MVPENAIGWHQDDCTLLVGVREAHGVVVVDVVADTADQDIRLELYAVAVVAVGDIAVQGNRRRDHRKVAGEKVADTRKGEVQGEDCTQVR